MVKFAEILSAYVPEHSANDTFKHLIAGVCPNHTSAPLDREKALRNMKAGNEWHNNMVRLCGSYVREGLGLPETLDRFSGTTLPGYTIEETIAEITAAYNGAKAKGYDQNNKSRAIDPVDEDAHLPDLPFLQWLHEISDAEPDFLIDGLFERNSLCSMFGQPASGKSFIAVDVAASISSGTPFHGLKVQQGDVVVIAGEGNRALKRRFRAWCKHHGIDERLLRVMISKSSISYTDEKVREQLAKELNIAKSRGLKPVLFIVDTLARAFGNADENSNADMGKFIANVDYFNARFDCATLIIHHSGHGENQRGRGASALRGALDAEFKCLKQASIISMKCSKMKDFSAPDDLTFNLKTIHLGYASDGKAISSAVLERDETATIRPKITPAITRDLGIFREAATEHGGKITLNEVVLEYRVSLENWRDTFYRRATQENAESKRKAFERCRKSLVEKGFLEVDDDLYKLKLHEAGQTGQKPDK